MAEKPSIIPGHQIARTLQDFMSNFWRDLSYGLRMLTKSRTATAVALLALALGIGVNVGCFISVNALVLHPFPFPHLERVMPVWETLPKLRTQREAVAPANFRDLQDQSRSFESIAAYRDWGVNLTGIGDPESLYAVRVTPGFFSVLGIRPAAGRTFSSAEAQPARSGVVVVSEGFWRRKLAGSPQAIGQTISLNGRSYTIVGIMPATFNFPLSTDVWAPLALSIEEQNQRAAHSLLVIGRLRRNVNPAQAQAEAATIGERLSKQYPDTNRARGMLVVPVRELTNGDTNRFVTTLLGAGTFVLLLACANVGNLQLARASVRQREIAVRAAMGATDGQIARQLLAENLVLAILGGLLGLALASWNLALTKQGIPPAAFRWVAGLRDMHIDGFVVAFTAVSSVLTGLLCGAPAIFQLLRHNRQTGLNDTLKESGRSSSAGLVRSRMRSALVVSELALALVLLVGAGLMVKAFGRMLDRNLGYDPKNLLRLQVSLPNTRYRDDAQIRSFYSRVLSGFAAIPGVKAAGMSSSLAQSEGFFVEGRPEPAAGEPRPGVFVASPNFLAAQKIPILEGRSISPNDQPDSPPVVVISEVIARHYWPHSDPVGSRIKLGNAQSSWLKIVGVCGDVRDWFQGDPLAAAYVPYTQSPPASALLSIRTAGDPMQFAPEVRAKIARVDRELPIYELESMEQSLFEQTSGVRMAATTMSVYAVIALLLAATGIYAVMSYFVAQRTHDIGVRMALGADTAAVLKLTLGQTGRLIIIGLAIGIPAAFALSKLMSGVLFNFVSLDLMTFASFTALLALLALIASYVPARRATRIDPVLALRQD